MQALRAATAQAKPDRITPSEFLINFKLFGEKSMSVERTLSIIKPDAVAKNVIGQIYTRFENAGLKIVGAQMRHLSRAEAERF